MDIASEIMKLDSKKRSGTLRTFGCWFGRPMDNYHQSIEAEFDGEILKILFDGGEILEVWNPSELVIEKEAMKILKAFKVKWSWYYYGKPKTPNNLLYYEYIVDGDNVISKSNSPWSTKPIKGEAAVELCHMPLNLSFPSFLQKWILSLKQKRKQRK